ncbi:MAG: MBL fold metallo-hydrolase [Clostridia bacterium]|nr:MBL fold metallo-hydrolase [Clostridia bacterium]
MKTVEVITIPVGCLQTNCYVVTNGDHCIVVDPGGDYEKISAIITRRGCKPDSVLLTHGHFDHISALMPFAESGCKVFIHKDDAYMLSHEDNLATSMGMPTLSLPTPDVLIDDGDLLTIGEMSIRVLHTPGHTMGSCCYDLDGQYLFSGDTLFYHSFGRTDFPGGDPRKMVFSLKKVFSLAGERVVFPGHGRQSILSEEREYFADWLL